MTEKTTIIDDYNLEMLLKEVFNWAYGNDVDLYKNLDYAFTSRYGSGLKSEQEEILRKNNILETHTIMEILERAITLADFQDTIKFQLAFIINNNSTHKAHGTYTWKYSSEQPHPYSALIPQIRSHMKSLEEEGLDDWHKSLDHDKHRHFRYWINKFLTDGKYYSLRLFVQTTGNTRCFDTVHVGNSECELFQYIMEYILEHNICPDPHNKKLEVPDFVNPDNYNKRYIESSGRFGGFWHLVYLTAAQLHEIYKTKIKRRKLTDREKAYWGYINAMPSDNKTKFYLFLT